MYIGYIRVSTLKQVKGHSLDYQKEALVNYCALHAIELKKIFVDEGISGVKERPKLKQAMDTVLSQESISGLLTYTISRFGRSASDLLFNIERLLEKNKSFASVKENFDPSTKHGKMMFTVISAIAEYDRENIIEQMAAGRAYAEKHGTKSGKPMHRPKTPIDWDQVNYYREHKLSWRKIAPLVGVTAPTLIKRARDRGYSIMSFDVTTVPNSAET